MVFDVSSGLHRLEDGFLPGAPRRNVRIVGGECGQRLIPVLVAVRTYCGWTERREMEYAILQGSNVTTLWAAVCSLIAEGWAPQGGVAYGKQKWVQAMTRDPLAKALQSQNSSIYGGNGTSEKP